MMLMTAVEEKGEADIDVQVQRKLQCQTPQALIHFLIGSLEKTQSLKKIDSNDLSQATLN